MPLATPVTHCRLGHVDHSLAVLGNGHSLVAVLAVSLTSLTAVLTAVTSFTSVLATPVTLLVTVLAVPLVLIAAVLQHVQAVIFFKLHF